MSWLIFSFGLFIDKPSPNTINPQLGKALENSIHRNKCECPKLYKYDFKQDKMICKTQQNYSCQGNSDNVSDSSPSGINPYLYDMFNSLLTIRD